MQKKYRARNVSSIRHMSICVEGVLAWRKKLTFFSDPKTGREYTDREARDWLKLARAQGKKVIPMNGEECPGWSHENGCRGHITAIKPNDEKTQEIEREWLYHLAKSKTSLLYAV